MPGYVYAEDGTLMYDTGVGLVPIPQGFGIPEAPPVQDYLDQIGLTPPATGPLSSLPPGELPEIVPGQRLSGRPLAPPAFPPPFAADLPGARGAAEPNIAAPSPLPAPPPAAVPSLPAQAGLPALAPIDPYGAAPAGIAGQPELPEQIQRAYEQQIAGVGAEAEAKAEQERIRAAGQLDVARQVQEGLDEESQLAQEGFQAADRAVTQIWGEMDALRKQKINPWADVSDGQRTAGIIAATIAGFLNPTGPNSAIEALNGMLNRNMQAQQANIDNEQRALEQKFGLAKERRYAAQDRLESGLRIRMATREAMIQEVDALAAGLNDEILLAQAQALKGKLMEEQAKDAHKVGMDLAALNIEAGKLALAARKQAARGTGAAKRDPVAMNNAVIAKWGAEAVRESGVSDPALPQGGHLPVAYAMFGRPLDVSAFRTMQAEVTHAAKQLGSIMEQVQAGVTAKAGDWTAYFGTEEGRALRSRYGSALANFVRAMSGKAATDAEAKRLMEALPPPEKLGQVSPEKAWASFHDDLGQWMQIQADGLGVITPDGTRYDFASSIRALRPSKTTAEQKAAAEIEGEELPAPDIPVDAPEAEGTSASRYFGEPGIIAREDVLTAAVPFLSSKQLADAEITEALTRAATDHWSEWSRGIKFDATGNKILSMNPDVRRFKLAKTTAGKQAMGLPAQFPSDFDWDGYARMYIRRRLESMTEGRRHGEGATPGTLPGAAFEEQ